MMLASTTTVVPSTQGAETLLEKVRKLSSKPESILYPFSLALAATASNLSQSLSCA